jgi:glycosyltransferase involved in cell wall biosynthesis
MRVTIIIPTLNSSAFIQETVRYYHSLVRDINEIEAVIIVDDHSSDGTYEIMLQEKKALQSSIKLISLDRNYGQLIAYRAGESLAKTDIIVHCDDDVLLSQSDLQSYIDRYAQGTETILYGLIPGKNSSPKGRNTFYWVVQNFLFYHLRGKEFSSLRIFRKDVLDHIFNRAIGYHGNLHTPWLFRPDELDHVTLSSGSRVIPHPSRYSLSGYFHHQVFLFLVLCRVLSFVAIVALGIAIMAGVLRASHPFTIFMLVITPAIFILSLVFLKIKSKLHFGISRHG